MYKRKRTGGKNRRFTIWDNAPKKRTCQDLTETNPGKGFNGIKMQEGNDSTPEAIFRNSKMVGTG